LLNNLIGAKITGIVANKKKLLNTNDLEPADVIILSTLLAGEEDLVQVVVKILQVRDTRFIILAKTKNEPVLKELFFSRSARFCF